MIHPIRTSLGGVNLLKKSIVQIPSQEMIYCFEEARGNWLDEGSPWSAVSLEEVC